MTDDEKIIDRQKNDDTETDAENAEETAAWLNARGIETEPIRTAPINGGRMTFFRDPDGLPLELHE